MSELPTKYTLKTCLDDKKTLVGRDSLGQANAWNFSYLKSFDHFFLRIDCCVHQRKSCTQSFEEWRKSDSKASHAKNHASN